MDTEPARADYYEGSYYYYTEDHIGRPINLRDNSRVISWWEQHEPFGELIDQDTPQGELLAGASPYSISWTPPFRFPGQYQEEDMYPFTQNHYREYMAGEGRYNRVDPLIDIIENMGHAEFSGANLNKYHVFILDNLFDIGNLSFTFVYNNPIGFFDFMGLKCTRLWDDPTAYSGRCPPQFWNLQGPANPFAPCRCNQISEKLPGGGTTRYTNCLTHYKRDKDNKPVAEYYTLQFAYYCYDDSSCGDCCPNNCICSR